MTISRFTYAIAFPTFTTAIAGDLSPPKAVDGIILFFLVPVIIVFINGLGVRVCTIENSTVDKVSELTLLSFTGFSNWLVVA